MKDHEINRPDLMNRVAVGAVAAALNLLGKAAPWMGLLLIAAFPSVSNAQQFDARYYELEKKHAAKWAEEDKAIDAKLAALEQKFGKKPNIIYILADDVGFGELGWQGGGKHRGTPSPELDKMAYEGMRFMWSYSEPSCTPNRSTLTQGGMDLTKILTVGNAKYMFLTHLHEDHTVGLPSFILSLYKFGSTTDKVIFGPPGTEGLIHGIVEGWSLDRQEMVQGSTHQSPQGSGATVGEVDFDIGAPGPIFEDDNVKVEAFPTEHGSLAHTLAFRFTTKPDGRVIAFGGDGHYSKGLVEAAKGADILVIEGITRKNIKYATWGGDTVEEKVKTIGAYHMFPSDMKKVQDESGVETIVMVHEQNFNAPKDFSRTGLRDEMRKAGVQNIFSAIDGDMY